MSTQEEMDAVLQFLEDNREWLIEKAMEREAEDYYKRLVPVAECPPFICSVCGKVPGDQDCMTYWNVWSDTMYCDSCVPEAERRAMFEYLKTCARCGTIGQYEPPTQEESIANDVDGRGTWAEGLFCRACRPYALANLLCDG